MRHVRNRSDAPTGWVMALVAGLLCASIGVAAQEEGTRNGEWPSYGGDLAHTRYSPLDEIDGSNFSELEVAWSFRTDNFGPRPEFFLQVTPLMVDGTLYATVGTRRAGGRRGGCRAGGSPMWMTAATGRSST